MGSQSSDFSATIRFWNNQSSRKSLKKISPPVPPKHNRQPISAFSSHQSGESHHSSHPQQHQYSNTNVSIITTFGELQHGGLYEETSTPPVTMKIPSEVQDLNDAIPTKSPPPVPPKPRRIYVEKSMESIALCLHDELAQLPDSTKIPIKAEELSLSDVVPTRENITLCSKSPPPVPPKPRRIPKEKVCKESKTESPTVCLHEEVSLQLPVSTQMIIESKKLNDAMNILTNKEGPLCLKSPPPVPPKPCKIQRENMYKDKQSESEKSQYLCVGSLDKASQNGEIMQFDSVSHESDQKKDQLNVVVISDTQVNTGGKQVEAESFPLNNSEDILHNTTSSPGSPHKKAYTRSNEHCLDFNLLGFLGTGSEANLRQDLQDGTRSRREVKPKSDTISQSLNDPSVVIPRQMVSEASSLPIPIRFTSKLENKLLVKPKASKEKWFNITKISRESEVQHYHYQEDLHPYASLDVSSTRRGDNINMDIMGSSQVHTEQGEQQLSQQLALKTDALDNTEGSHAQAKLRESDQNYPQQLPMMESEELANTEISDTQTENSESINLLLYQDRTRTVPSLNGRRKTGVGWRSRSLQNASSISQQSLEARLPESLNAGGDRSGYAERVIVQNAVHRSSDYYMIFLLFLTIWLSFFITRLSYKDPPHDPDDW